MVKCGIQEWQQEWDCTECCITAIKRVYSIHGYSMVMDVGNINFSMIIRIIALVGIKRASLFSYVVYTVCIVL